MLRDEYGIRQMFHPHADTHVDREDRIGRFLEDTDPAAVSLCLDTGHVAYAGGDNRAIIVAHQDRIGYVHLKSVDPDVMAKVRAGRMSFARAARAGAMTEPDRGEPDMPPLLADLDALGRPLWAIVEHDMYPAPPDAPLPIATRTCRYYRDRGLCPRLPAACRGRQGGAAPLAEHHRAQAQLADRDAGAWPYAIRNRLPPDRNARYFGIYYNEQTSHH